MLQLSSVDTHYGQAHILHDVNLAVGRGEAVALIGRNGAGKSTLLKTVMGLVPATHGWITFNGHNLVGQPPHRIAQYGLGYVPEDRRVFPALTVAENLEVGRRPPARRRSVSRPPWTPERLFDVFPNLAALAARPAGEISGGEQQMLAIARTLMGNPRALLLDEPSEGLAPVIVEPLATTLLDLRDEGLTILLCEQNRRFAEAVTDRILSIDRGRIGPAA